jgi:uncharacterized repeat protein (TIGR01451 family)
VRAEDDQGNITWSYLPNGEAACRGDPHYSGPTPSRADLGDLPQQLQDASPSKSANVQRDPDQRQRPVHDYADRQHGCCADQYQHYRRPARGLELRLHRRRQPGADLRRNLPTVPDAGATGDITWDISAAAIPAQSGTWSHRHGAVGDWHLQQRRHRGDQRGPLPTDPVQVAVGAPQRPLPGADATGYNPGDTITYTITYSNDSPVTVTNAVITDSVPNGTTYVSCGSSPVVPCSQAGGVVTWTIGSLAAGEGPYTATMQVTVQDPYPSTAPIPLVNTAIIDSDQTAPESASAYSLVNSPRPSLAIQKRSTVTQVTPAAPPAANVTFTIDYFNTGNAPAYNVVIRPIRPAGHATTSGPGSNAGGDLTIGTSQPAPAAGDRDLNADPGIHNPTVNTAPRRTIDSAGWSRSRRQAVDRRPTQISCTSPETYYFRTSRNVSSASCLCLATTTAPTGTETAYT